MPQKLHFRCYGGRRLAFEEVFQRYLSAKHTGPPVTHGKTVKVCLIQNDFP